MKIPGYPTNGMRLLLAILLVSGLATAVVPVLSADREDLARDAALEDCSRIAAALRRVMEDTGRTPAERLDGRRESCLLGDGETPAGLFAPEDLRGDLAELVSAGDATAWGEGWDGPYMMRPAPDPWGHAYVVTVTGFESDPQTVWVVSAGPDGILETGPMSREPAGDDIGLALER